MLSKQTTINMWRHAHLFRIYGTIDMENQWLWKIEKEWEGGRDRDRDRYENCQTDMGIIVGKFT